MDRYGQKGLGGESLFIVLRILIPQNIFDGCTTAGGGGVFWGLERKTNYIHYNYILEPLDVLIGFCGLVNSRVNNRSSAKKRAIK